MSCNDAIPLEFKETTVQFRQKFFVALVQCCVKQRIDVCEKHRNRLAKYRKVPRKHNWLAFRLPHKAFHLTYEHRVEDYSLTIVTILGAAEPPLSQAQKRCYLSQDVVGNISS